MSSRSNAAESTAAVGRVAGSTTASASAAQVGSAPFAHWQLGLRGAVGGGSSTADSVIWDSVIDRWLGCAAGRPRWMGQSATRSGAPSGGDAGDFDLCGLSAVVCSLATPKTTWAPHIDAAENRAIRQVYDTSRYLGPTELGH